MSQKPLIGITCNYDYRDTIGVCSGSGANGQDWNFVAGDYIYCVERAGGIPVLLPQCEKFETIRSLLDRLDGVVISGGNDIGPERYGKFPKCYCGAVVPARDEQDISVAKYMIFQRSRPVLGVCRGAQIINVALGGTLYQDLEKEGGFEHHLGDKRPRNTAWHQVTLSKVSKLHNIYGTEELWVNSFHHQAISKAGSNLEIAAVSSDGVPEAIELKGYSFVIGVQWHPEMMYDSKQQRLLISAFINACTKG